MDNTNDQVGVLISALEKLAAQDSGIVASSAKSDCMAATAKAALRNYKAAAIQHSEQRQTVTAGAVVRICALRDRECGEFRNAWCDTCPKRAAIPKVSDRRSATDAEVAEWAERHDLTNILGGSARAAFEDAESLHMTFAAPVAAPVPEAKADPYYWQKHTVFSTNILGRPMREYAPGKWESSVWPSEARAEQAGYPYQALFNSIGAAVEIQGIAKAISVKAFVSALQNEGYQITPAAPAVSPSLHSVKHEASELPPLPKHCIGNGGFNERQMRAYGQACIDSRSPVVSSETPSATVAAAADGSAVEAAQKMQAARSALSDMFNAVEAYQHECSTAGGDTGYSWDKALEAADRAHKWLLADVKDYSERAKILKAAALSAAVPSADAKADK